MARVASAGVRNVSLRESQIYPPQRWTRGVLGFALKPKTLPFLGRFPAKGVPAALAITGVGDSAPYKGISYISSRLSNEVAGLVLRLAVLAGCVPVMGQARPTTWRRHR